jgi:hypothetical protein
VIVKVILVTNNHSGLILDEVGRENILDASLSTVSDGFFPLETFENTLLGKDF